MKMRKIAGLLVLAIIALSCEKEPIELVAKNESSIKYVGNLEQLKKGGTSPFEIIDAGVWSENLYMNVRYTGGLKKHEFAVNWDGKVLTQGDKKIVSLDIYHLTNNDNGEAFIQDSLFLSLAELNLPTKLDSVDLWYDVVNTSNPENHFLVKSFFPNTDTIIIQDTITIQDTIIIQDSIIDQDSIIVNDSVPIYKSVMEVVKRGSVGYNMWEEFFLLDEKHDSSALYFPMKIEEGIVYTPKERDKLKISFEYINFADSSYYGDSLNFNRLIAIKITELEKIE